LRTLSGYDPNIGGSDMSDEARFWDRRAEKYALRPVAGQEAYEKKLEITRSYFPRDSEVLEMGCGTGSTALVHAPYVRHILATDISPAMINIARGKAEAEQRICHQHRLHRRHVLVLQAHCPGRALFEALSAG
jgi:SAM-dependent methyltransferase